MSVNTCNCVVCCQNHYQPCCQAAPTWPADVVPPLIPFDQYSCAVFEPTPEPVVSTREPCDVCPITPRPFESKIITLCDPRVRIRLPLQPTGSVGVTDTVLVTEKKCGGKKGHGGKKNKGNFIVPLRPFNGPVAQNQVAMQAY